MSDALRISPKAALYIWGSRSPFFRKFGDYWHKIYEENPETKRLARRATPQPITDFREAIALLYEGFSDRTQRHIDLQAILPDGTRGPAVVIQIFNGGYGKCEFSGEHVLPLATEVLEELQRDRLLRGTPHMGYTDMNELHLSDHAIDRIFKEIEAYTPELEEE